MGELKRPPPITADAVIAMSGLAKLFVGDVVEHARTAYGETLSDGALDPEVIGRLPGLGNKDCSKTAVPSTHGMRSDTN